MGRSVRELLATVDAAELAEWEALYTYEPWGEARGDLQAGTIACVQANTWRGKGRAAQLKDFLPDFWGERRQSPQDMTLALMAIAAATQQ